MTNKISLTFFVTFLIFALSSNVISGEMENINNSWRVIQTNGTTQTKGVKTELSGQSWRSINTGETLTGPIFLRTGQDSRIILKHRNDKITIASNSLLKLEAEEKNEEGILTKIIQTIGYSLFDIEKNTGRKNIIETPYLVSVVKGTTFSVHVNQGQTIVNLIEGQLQINALHFNASTIINTGQIAQLAKGDRTISVIDASTQVSPTTLINNATVNSISANNDANSQNISNASPSVSNTTVTTIPSPVNAIVSDSALISNGETISFGNNGHNDHNDHNGNNGNNGNNGFHGRGNNGKGKGNHGNNGNGKK